MKNKCIEANIIYFLYWTSTSTGEHTCCKAVTEPCYLHTHTTFVQIKDEIRLYNQVGIWL